MIKEQNEERIHSSSSKSQTLADILPPEVVEELSKLGSHPPRKRTSLSMTKKDFECVLSLEPRHKKGGYQVIIVTPKVAQSKKLQQALLWHAIYGNKSFRVIDWNILFNYFNRTLVDDKVSLAILGILRILAVGQSPSDKLSFSSTLYSVRQIVANSLGKEIALEFCQRLQNLLGVKLPTSVETLDKLLKIEDDRRTVKKPREPARIGVGYKDKGTLSNTPRMEPLSGDWIEPFEDCFLSLLKKTENCRAFDCSYDKTKRKKLLQKILKSFKEEE